MGSAPQEPLSAGFLARLRHSPEVYPQALDIVRDAILLVQLGEHTLRNASFLDDRVLVPGIHGAWFGIDQLFDIPMEQAVQRPLHFIFHTGHVGSTLVSRLLDEFTAISSLREPAPLRTLAEAYDVRDSCESLLTETRLEDLLNLFMNLWRRGFSQTRAVVIKATSHAGRMAPVLLGRNTEARALYLNVSAETYIATHLAGANSMIDLRGLAAGRLRRLQMHCHESPGPLYALSPGELAAMSWLSETFNLHSARQQLGSRILALDFDSFLTSVDQHMARIVAHLNLPLRAGVTLNCEHSTAMRRYSKDPASEFSPRHRAQVLEHSWICNRSEILRGQAWLRNLTARNAAAAAATFGHAT